MFAFRDDVRNQRRSDCDAMKMRLHRPPTDEAIALLDELKAHATQPKYLYRLKYGVGDLVIWDNASLLHSATLIDPNDARTLWRITVKEPAS